MDSSTINKIVKQIALGSQGLIVSAQGLGTMGMTAFYSNDDVSEEDKINVIGKALEQGINFLDTAHIYINFTTGESNEVLVGKALKKFGREKFVVATKFGIEFNEKGLSTSGKPEFIRKQIAESLKKLDIEYIDLYYMHRMDPNTPIEETMQCLLELKNEGKIKYVGLSECTPEELERAHKIFPISAIQMEYSLHNRNIEGNIIPTARKLGVGIVAYSPLGRGILSRTFTDSTSLNDNDWRKQLPRFQKENMEENTIAALRLEEYGKSKGLTAAQLSLAWLHNKSNDIIPIPGTKSSKRIEENAFAASVVLTKEEIAYIEALIPEAKGQRYDENSMKRSYELRL